MKFLKAKIGERIIKKAAKLRAKGMANLEEKGIMGVSTIYSTYFYSLKGYLTGKPTVWQVRAFRFVIKGVDNKENGDMVKKLKAVHKKARNREEFSVEDMSALQETFEWVEKNCMDDTGKVLNVLGKDFDDSNFSKTYKKLKKQEGGKYK